MPAMNSVIDIINKVNNVGGREGRRPSNNQATAKIAALAGKPALDCTALNRCGENQFVVDCRSDRRRI